jgi:hypothetical protein
VRASGAAPASDDDTGRAGDQHVARCDRAAGAEVPDAAGRDSELVAGRRGAVVVLQRDTDDLDRPCAGVLDGAVARHLEHTAGGDCRRRQTS